MTQPRGALGARSDTPPVLLWQEGVVRELKTDLGRAGDLTTDAIVGPEEPRESAPPSA